MPQGIKPVTRRLATGEVRTYWYHRATGQRIDPEGELKPHSAAWLAEIARLDERGGKAAKASEKAQEHGRTYFELWAAYRDSQEWRDLRPRTRSDYQAVRDWIGDAAARAMVVRLLTDDVVIRLRDKAARQRGRRFANYVLAVVRLTLEWGRDRGWFGRGEKKLPNPAMGLKSIARPKHAVRVNRAWTRAEVVTVAQALPFQLLVPFSMGLFAGMREGDALSVTWRAYDGARLKWRASKNSEDCEAPVTGVFKTVLDRAKADAKARKVVRPEIATNSYGEPWSASGFRASFFKILRRLRDEGKIGSGCTFHGLRYTVTAAARDGGSSNFQASAAIGDRTTAMADLYGRDADRLAAQTTVLEAIQKQFGNVVLENALENGPGAPDGLDPQTLIG